MAKPSAPILFFNSLSKEMEPFKPIDPERVRLYSCGPTVYNFAHLGNLRAYIFTDSLRRMLNWKGYPVNHVINITDVGHLTSDTDTGDDKMEAAANRAHKTIWEIARFYTEAFWGDLKNLNIFSPTIWSIATDHIQDMIAFARKIEASGFTYQLESGLYFDTSRLKEYGMLAGHREEEGVGRIETVVGKKHPADFALWRRSAPDEKRQMEWMSPWGAGAPGWHLECSVMSMKYLGEQFDIHTGGIDHREIHHCNEIAQNQAFTGNAQATGANFWLHNNFLVDRSGKMSKSKGTFLTLSTLIDAGIHPLAYRVLCLSAHYRSELEFSPENILAALTRLKRLVIAVGHLKSRLEKKADVDLDKPDWLRPYDERSYSKGAPLDYQRSLIEAPLKKEALAVLERFDQAISHDLMLPQALPLLEETLSNKKLQPEERLRLIASMDMVLGLNLLHLDRASLNIRPKNALLPENNVLALLEERQNMRKAKDFAASDAIRARLSEAGIEVLDGDPLGWEWKPQWGD
ncbi:MAG: cysteine--tRNA ligase [Zymomonas mobilis subsp. pomaceae]|uniref:Cysteine--tRNA ligase n=1 Tax=Zymomonas mobilis subsp. pomaceae (strain ATCC 29192 / DSM 22645 / JCM 10191 / CCUG 17912 / NBRC 13757 / NCIMB 11200 / NRRL B-4491 / Barker I) TaxID=579138 RepID=F8ESX8_ZYMMT|nr:cysteine--tRNA ligase [Zymomonas mobilis]AEI37882.1 cysteinyl-tRNA synthetase [Zymomonas mobilis subsp. pomaceae ATCC 29192]MDX5949248.1 cysteine--tRNA ligase [Zymomonas mobilis subsp. pomaceae]GEB89522.1 cysteine--tRNA ligase [Zymomonas mobilis subsp. pomaceae]